MSLSIGISSLSPFIFGDSNPTNDSLTWDEMRVLLKQIDGSAGGGGGDKDVHVYAATGGPKQILKSRSQQRQVTNGTFRVVNSTSPSRHCARSLHSYATYSDNETLQYDSREPPTFIKPMHITSNDKVTSELIIDIVPDKGLKPWFPAELITEFVPTALWVACKFASTSYFS